MARTVKTEDNYLSRVLKHIPSEIVMAYVAIEGALRASYTAPQERERLLWGALIVLTVLTPLWLWRVMNVRRLSQLFISTLSLPVWLFALGGPFEYLCWYRPALGAIVLPIYTLIVPIITS